MRRSFLAAWLAVLPTLFLARPGFADNPYTYINVDEYHLRVWYEKVGQGHNSENAAKGLIYILKTRQVYERAKEVMLGRTPCSHDNLFVVKKDGKENTPLKNYLPPDGYLEIYLIDPNPARPHPHAIDGLIDRFNDHSGGPNAIDLLGVTYDQGEGSSSLCAHPTIIGIDITRIGGHIESTLAHELFHAFQANFPPFIPWLHESTASWFEDYVLPEANEEWHDLWADNNLWSTANTSGSIAGPLNGSAFQYFPYSSYLWFYYLTHEGGYDPGIIGQIFVRSAHADPVLAIRDLTDFQHDFKQFALYNWNAEPVDTYRDLGLHISALRQQTRRSVVSSSAPTEIPIKLDPTQIGYYELQPVEAAKRSADRDMKQLVIDLSKLQDKKDIGVQGIITIGVKDTPSYQGKFAEDWTGFNEKRFCLDRSNENVTNVVLIVDHHGVTAAGAQPVDAKITARPAKACAEPPGNYSYQANSSCGYNNQDESVSYTGRYSIQSAWTLKFAGRDADDLDGVHYKIFAETHYNVTGSGSERFNKKSGKIYIRSNATESTGASGTAHNPPRPGEDQYKEDQRAGGGNSEEGELYVYTQDGRDHYEITLDLAGVAQSGSFSSSSIQACLARPPKPALSESMFINYRSGDRLSVARGCNADQTNHSHETGLEMIHDPLVNRERLFTGTFNRKSGRIDTHVDGHSSNPVDAQSFTADAVRTIPGDVEGKPLKCDGSYQAQLRLAIPTR